MIKHLKVLIVDDDPAIAEVLSAFLTSKGYTVATCLSGEEGLGLLGETPFDLIVSDLEMPGVNGLEFLRQARARCPHVAFICVTAYEDRYPAGRVIQAGADGYVSKPFSLKKFAIAFERAYWRSLSRRDWSCDDVEGEPHVARVEDGAPTPAVRRRAR